ncbi:MAG: hypothetical protein ACR2PL_23505 [Dehalococcoidia bacterium]
MMTTQNCQYEVVITREGNWWLADVPSIAGAHTHARTLAGLARRVREVVVLMNDLSLDALDAIELRVIFQLPEALTAAIQEAEEARRQCDAAQARVIEATSRAREAIAAGDSRASARDIATILRLSHQRVHQFRTRDGGQQRRRKGAGSFTTARALVKEYPKEAVCPVRRVLAPRRGDSGGGVQDPALRPISLVNAGAYGSRTRRR